MNSTYDIMIGADDCLPLLFVSGSCDVGLLLVLAMRRGCMAMAILCVLCDLLSRCCCSYCGCCGEKGSDCRFPIAQSLQDEAMIT